MFGWIRRYRQRRAARKAEAIAAKRARELDVFRTETIHLHNTLGSFTDGMLFGQLLQSNHPPAVHHTTIHNHPLDHSRGNADDRPETTRREELPAPDVVMPALEPVSWLASPATDSYDRSSPPFDSGSSSSYDSGSSGSYDSGSSGGGDW